jgi:hypothetical protein
VVQGGAVADVCALGVVEQDQVQRVAPELRAVEGYLQRT